MIRVNGKSFHEYLHDICDKEAVEMMNRGRQLKRKVQMLKR